MGFKPMITAIMLSAASCAISAPTASLGSAAASEGSSNRPISNFVSDSTDPNVMCIALHCGTKLFACETTQACKGALQCVRTCKNADPVEKQRCQIICTEANPSPRYDDLVACMVNNQCMPTKKPAVCARPRNREALAPVTLGDLDGSWYVIRGLSRTYDCWSCQKMSFTRTNGNLSRYEYEYSVVASTRTSISCTIQGVRDGAPDTPAELMAGRFQVNYTAHNISGKDDWYVVGYTGDYAMIYYCGDRSVDSYRGAVVISRWAAGELPADIQAQFARALKEADIAIPVTLDEFCSPDNSRCP